MKALLLFSFFYLVNLSTSYGFVFVEPNNEVVLKNATEAYNKNSSNISKAKADEKFLKDFDSKLKTLPKNKPWKAEFIGNTVYFKKDREIFKINLVEIKSSSNFTLSVNGKNFVFNERDGFKKNYELLKRVMRKETASSLWDLIIPTANALEMEAPEELEDKLSSALSWTTWLSSSIRDQGDIQKERICNLNEEEYKSKYKAVGSKDTLLSEIKFLIQIQDKYVKNNMRDQKSGGECYSTRCKELKEFQTCISEVAKRRNEGIVASGYGFKCYEKFEDNYVYLNSDNLTSALQGKNDSFELQLKAIEYDRLNCQHKPYPSQEAECNKRIEQRITKLKNDCPQDQTTFSKLQKTAVERAKTSR